MEVIMTKILFILISLASFAVAGSASAADCPPEMVAMNACSAWAAAADAPLYTSAKRAASDSEVSCLEIRSRTKTAVLVYGGKYVENADEVGVNVITRFRQMSDWVKAGDGSWSKMICIPKKWLKRIKSFTICGDVGHYYFNATETGYFKRQSGRLTSEDVARMWQGG